MRKNILRIFTIFLLIGTLLTGASLAADTQFSLLVCNMAHPFFVDLVKGAQDAAKELGIEVLTYDAQDDSAQQVHQVEDSVVLGVKALILNPTDVDALVPAVKKVVEEGIPVFTADRDVRNVGQLAYIGTNNTEAAKEGAQKMLSLLEEAGKEKPWRVVVLEGTPGASSAIERGNGFMHILEPLQKTGEVEIVASLAANFDRAKGLNVMQDILATDRDIDAVIAANDEMALGAVTAMKEAGLKVGYPDGVIIVGFDAITDAFESIRKGEMVATVAQAPYLMGYWGVHAAYANLNEGWNPPEGTPVYEPTGSLHLGTPSLVVTSANIDQAAELILTPTPIPR